MENPMVKQLIYSAFGMFYILCLIAAGYALMYYSSAH
jgi:hypothetical protein